MDPDLMIEQLGNCHNNLADALSSLEDIDVDDGDVEAKITEFHWAIKDLQDEIEKYMVFLRKE